MKTIKILLLIMLVAGTQFSCEESTVEIAPIGYTEEGFFQNPTDMDWAVKGIYHNLSFFYVYLQNQNNALPALWMLPGDDLTTDANYEEENFSGVTGSSNRVRVFYQYAYQLVARANTVLEQIEENGETIYAGNTELMNNHKGEALFLRAFVFERLWQIYGSAPIVTQRIRNIADAYPPNSTGTGLLDQAVNDLAEAAQLLPASWNAANLGRVTKNSAYGLRGKILVFRGTVNNAVADFTAAINDFDQIAGASLVPHYNMNFDALTENNAESLFEYQSNRSIGNANPFLVSNDFAVIGNIAAYYGIFSGQPTFVNNQYFYATPSIQELFEPGDPRTLYMLGKPPSAAANAPKANVNKYLLNPGANVPFIGGNNDSKANNPRILRYADVLLLKAEAIVRSGGSLSTAIGLINQIRERARNSSVYPMPVPPPAPAAAPADRDVNETDAAIVLEWIFDERRMELAFEEGHRWFDLRRRHLAGEIDLKTWDFQSALPDFQFEDRNIVYPLPEGEVIESPNLDQNPGF